MVRYIVSTRVKTTGGTRYLFLIIWPFLFGVGAAITGALLGKGTHTQNTERLLTLLLAVVAIVYTGASHATSYAYWNTFTQKAVEEDRLKYLADNDQLILDSEPVEGLSIEQVGAVRKHLDVIAKKGVADVQQKLEALIQALTVGERPSLCWPATAATSSPN
jgi:hypothetical protein